MQLLPNESILFEARPVRKLSLVWLFSKALPFGFYGAGLSLPAWIIVNSPPARGMPPPYPFALGWAVAAAAFAVSWLLAYVYYRSLVSTYHYQVTNQRFIFAGGILRRVVHAVEHRRVTDVQLSQNLVEQWLSLSSISLFTPGTASVRPNSRNQPMPELRLEGLPNGQQVFALVSDCTHKAKGGEP
jgi:hypothetical protein